jgi:hypothetical protein
MSKRYQGGILGVGFNPLQAPNAPTIGTAVKGDATASVAFTAPANVGGSAITSYAVQSTPGNVGASGASSPITVSGLTNGTGYTFRVTALNSYGPSPASGASNSVTPSAPVGWIGIIASSGEDGPRGIALDSSNNIYLNGYTNSPSTPYGYAVIKLSNLGAIQWQRKLSKGSTNAFGTDITVDSGNNVYVVGTFPLNGFQQSGVLAKYNSSGTLQWQRGLNPSNGNISTSKVTTNSVGDVYFSGAGIWTANANYNAGFYAKYNSSGTYQSVTSLKVYTNDQVRSDYTAAIKVDNSGNIYTAGLTSDNRPPNFFPPRSPATWTFIVTAKYDSSNTLLWLKKLIAGPEAYGADIALDSSGDIYVAAQSGYSGTTQCLLLKYNTSGVLQWQRELGDASTSQGWQKIAIDGSGDIYCAGFANIGGNADALFAKYNSAGTLQWQRRLASSSANYTDGLTVGSDGNFYVCVSLFTSTAEMLIAKLPTNGDGTGTYVVNGTSITYAATSLTGSTPSYAQDPDAFNAGGGLSTSGSSTSDLTDSGLTLTVSTTPV